MNKKYIKGVVLLGLTTSIALSSCQTQKYKAPSVDTIDLFRGENSQDSITIANIPWREYFSDPYLQGYIDEGINNNFDMRIATSRIQQAEASLSMARAAYFPTVALAGQVNHDRRSVNSSGKKDILGSQTTQYSLGIAVTWEADIWGKMNKQAKANYAQYLGSQAYRNLVQTSLISNIATTYYSLLALDEQLKVTKEMIVLLGESTETMQAMMDAGMLNGASVKQSEALLYGTEVTIPDLENQIRQLENSLSLLLGRKPGSIIRSNIAQQSVPTQLEFGVPAQMLAKRPDVQQAELSFRSAFELTNVARASFYPSLTLTSGTIGLGNNTLSQFFKPENIFANIVGGLTQPIFMRKQLKTNLKIAEGNQEQALLTFEQTVLSASQEVSNILYEYESSLRKNPIRTQQVQSLVTSVEFTQELLKAGESDYTAVLNAEQSLLQAQLNQVSDKLEQLQASVNLYRALGGGVE